MRPPFEKPPTYEESQHALLNMLGVPPPEYSANNSASQRQRSADIVDAVAGPSGEQQRAQQASRDHCQSGDDVDTTAANDKNGIDNPVFDKQE